MVYILCLFLFLLSTGLTYCYIQYAWRHKLLDTPNARSSHTHQTPRGGGLIFIGLWSITILLAFFLKFLSLQEICVLLPGTLLVSTIGFLDDRYNLPVYIRACGYLLAVLISVFALGGFNQIALNAHIIISLGYIGSLLAIIGVFWSINLFNFMDGLDGVAATEAFFILSVGGFFIAQSGGYTMAILLWLLVACIVGFLIWNKPPAKIFMGDSGSTALGFIIGVLALWSEKHYGIPLLLWLMLYGVFWTDATLTVIRRLIAKQPIYQAHRSHAYQRLQQAGFTHKQVLMIISGVNVLLVSLSLFGFYHREYLLFFALLAFGILLALYYWVEKINPMSG